MPGALALANPRRIKASHRRRRRVASDHLLYILNNPLSGTDPTGYACDTGTHIKGGGGPDCETTGATGTPLAENPTSAGAKAAKKAAGSGGNGGSGGQAATGNRSSGENTPDKKETEPKRDPNQLSTGQRVGSGAGAVLSTAAAASCVAFGLAACPESVGFGCLAAATCAVLSADSATSNATEAITGKAHTPAVAQGFSMLTGVSPQAAENGQNMVAAVAGIWSAGSVMQQIRGATAAPLSSAPSFGNALKVDDFPVVAANVSQKQLRHIFGRLEHAARGGGYLNSMDDAQAVLTAFRNGRAAILGRSSQGFPVVRFNGVTGTNVNVSAGFSNQPTNVFMIKGTASPSVVPVNPNWVPR